MADEVSPATATRRQMLRWFAALANADTSPATFVALGDSLLAQGSLQTAVDRLTAHYSPMRSDPVRTGYGWIPGAELEGDGTIDDRGGFDGAPRLLRDGEACSFRRLVVTSVDLYGSGTVEVALGDHPKATVELSTTKPSNIVVDGPPAAPYTVSFRARGDATIHGTYTYAGNEARGIRYLEVCCPGKTFRHFLEQTDSLAYLQTIQPDLLLVSLGVNDVAHEGLDSFEDNFTAFVARIRSDLPRTSLCYWFAHRASIFTPEEWDAARAVAERVCTTHDVTLIDGHAMFGSTAPEDDTEGLTFDGVHYSRTGKVLFSEAVLATIAPGLHMAPAALTSAPLASGQFHIGTGSGGSSIVGPHAQSFQLLQAAPPSPFSETGLFFSESLVLSVIEPTFPPPPGSAALFVRTGGDGTVELCLHLPDGSVRVLAVER